MAIARVNVDQQLLQKAKQLFGVRTDKEVIDLALRDAVLRRKQLDAIAALPLDVDPQPITYDHT